VPVDLDDVAEELYRLPPEEFIAARREREAQARAAGDRALAADIAALAKPSTAAWVSNLLAREQPEEIAGLVELGGLLREAQENLAGDELRALDVQRRQLVAALTRQARSLAYQQGHQVTTTVATQIEETLRAAMTDPDAGEALTAGRLTTALSYSGMGTGDRPDLHVVPPPRPARPAARPAPARKPGRSAADKEADDGGRRRAEERAEAARRAEEDRRRRELAQAQEAADQAAADAEEAATADEAERARVEELRSREDELEGRIDDLTAELTRVREECTQVGHDLSRAERRQKSAARRAADAVLARDRARRRVEELREP
jgi:hypothetical protein